MKNVFSATRMRRIDIVVAASLIVAVAVVLVGASVTNAVTKANQPPISSELAVMSHALSEADRLPKGFPSEAHGTGGLQAETARALGESAGVQFWVVQDAAHELCLVSNDSAQDFTAAACGSVGDLGDHGVSLSALNSRGQGFEAFLIPDNVSKASVPAPWVKAGPNLIVIDAQATSAPQLSLVPSDSAENAVEVSRFPRGR